MRFPARDLKGFCDYLKPADLVIGRVYFRVQFVDDASLVPELLPRVFLGRNLFPKEEGGKSFLYFTEYDPLLPPNLAEWLPTEWCKDDSSEDPTLEREEEAEYSGLVEFDDALEQLLECALRRQAKLLP